MKISTWGTDRLVIEKTIDVTDDELTAIGATPFVGDLGQGSVFVLPVTARPELEALLAAHEKAELDVLIAKTEARGPLQITAPLNAPGTSRAREAAAAAGYDVTIAGIRAPRPAVWDLAERVYADAGI